MLNAWIEGDPANRQTGEWDKTWTQITSNPFWGAFRSNTTNPGEIAYVNPTSANSPYSGTSVGQSGQGAGGFPAVSKAKTAAAAWDPAAADAAFAKGMTSGVGALGAGSLGALGGGASALTTWLDRLGGIGQLLGNTASQRAGERNLESIANAANYRTQQDALLKAFQLAMLSQQQLPGQMSRANLMANPPADLKLSTRLFSSQLIDGLLCPCPRKRGENAENRISVRLTAGL